MKCPTCEHLESRVVDSRLSKDGGMVRRRRECLGCGYRFTTYERAEETLPLIIKKDGSRELFDPEKLLRGIDKACEKRPVSIASRDELVKQVRRFLLESGGREVPSNVVGEKVMEGLQQLDKVAYVRFASVYREFKDIREFVDQVSILLNDERKGREG